MTSASLIEEEVREQLRERAIDPGIAPGQVRQVIAEVLESVSVTRARVGLEPPAADDVAREIFDSVVGLGPLQKYLDDSTIEEIWLNEPSRVFVARNGVSELTNTILDQAHVEMLVERMLRASGRRLDLSSPFCDAALNDGSRLHVAIPDITREFWAVNIRKFVASQYTLDDMVARGSLPRGLALILAACVEAGLNVLVSGQTQAGKTTMLNCLASAINPNERIVTCEEVFELQMSARDWVAMQCRQPNLEGTGEVTLRMLVKEALRMRPSRIIVGEVRQAESFDLLLALNSGLPGLATLHANSARRRSPSSARCPCSRDQIFLLHSLCQQWRVPSTSSSTLAWIVEGAGRRGRSCALPVASKVTKWRQFRSMRMVSEPSPDCFPPLTAKPVLSGRDSTCMNWPSRCRHERVHLRGLGRSGFPCVLECRHDTETTRGSVADYHVPDISPPM